MSGLDSAGDAARAGAGSRRRRRRAARAARRFGVVVLVVEVVLVVVAVVLVVVDEAQPDHRRAKDRHERPHVLPARDRRSPVLCESLSSQIRAAGSLPTGPEDRPSRPARSWRPRRSRPRSRRSSPSSSVAEAEAGRQLAAARRRCGRGSPACGGTVISPSTAQPELARARRRARGASSGAQPPFCSSPATFTCTSTARAGRVPRDRRRRARRGRPTATARRRGATRLHLVALQPADEVPHAARRRRPASSARDLRRELLRAVLAEVALPGRDRVDAPRRAPTSFDTTTSVTVAGSRPAARAPRPRSRSRTAARRSAIAGHGSTAIVAWRPVRAVAPVREVLGRRRRCTRRSRRASSTPHARERDAHRGGDVERGPAVVRAARDAGPEVRDEPREVVGAELVARGADARTEERAHRRRCRSRAARRPWPRSRRARGRGGRRARRRPRRRTRARSARSRR